MPETLWAAADTRAEAIGEDRSGYVRKLVQADLAMAGCLPGSPEAELKALFDQLVRTRGTEHVRAAIAPLFDSEVAAGA